MIRLDEDALICDFAETYHILDYRSLPAKLAATLAAGLRDDSRIKLRASGTKAGIDTVLLAAIADRVDAFRYSFSDEAKRGKQFTPQLVPQLMEADDKKDKRAVRGFSSAQEFERARARIIGDHNNGR